MSTYYNHFEYIPFDSRECEKALKTLEKYLEGKKEKTVLNVEKCCGPLVIYKNDLICQACSKVFDLPQETNIQIKHKSCYNNAKKFLSYKRFGWFDPIEKESILNLFLQVERIFAVTRDELRMPKIQFIFQKIFELRERPDLANKCEIVLSPRTKAKYEEIWKTISEWIWSDCF